MEDMFQPTPDPVWLLHDQGYDPLRERGIESRFAIGNGFLGVRGVPVIGSEDVLLSWPRTYVAGLFDTPEIMPRVPVLLSAPDWARITILVDGKPLLRSADDMVSHRRILDMRRGVLLTTWQSSAAVGTAVRVQSLRLVSLAERGIGLLLLRLDIDGQADIAIETSSSALDPTLEPVRRTGTLAAWRTMQSRMQLAMATSTALRLDGRELASDLPNELQSQWRWRSMPGQVACLERLAGFARSDGLDDNPDQPAQRTLANARRLGTHEIVRRHESTWTERWRCSDIELEGDASAQEALRFAIYHMNSAANPGDERVSVGARALTGDDYHGHVFWDTEIHLLPFYTMTWPSAARALLMYRYRTLPEARAKANRMGWRGAFYAWESASTGAETTPDEVVSAEGKLVKVLSGKEEEHISADVAYAVWQYWQATGDNGFLLDAGAEIIMETARFWTSRSQLESDGRRHIRGVEGPDEYHEHIDDNAFTNVMARWNIRRAIELATLLRHRWPERWAKLAGRIGIDDAELAEMVETSETIATGLDVRTGLFEQFAGFFNLREIDISQYADRTTPMDVVLGREQTQRSQVVKQADVVALLALLPEEFDQQSRLANFRYYEPRCDHGSSLSRPMHALVAARLGETELALRYFHEAASIDLADTAANSAGGVHIATLGGLWQTAVFGFAGLSVTDDAIALDPHLPKRWSRLGFRFQWRGRRLRIQIEQAGNLVGATLEDGEKLKLIVAGEAHELLPGPMLRVKPRA